MGWVWKERQSWRGSYRDEAGKQHTKSFKRQIDAKRWVATEEAKVVRGEWIDPSAGKITFATFYADWAPRQVWLSSTRENADLATASVTFGDMPLRSIRRSHIEGWVKNMTARLAPTTIDTRFTIVRGVFRAAVADRLIASDPTIGVVLPRRRKAEAAMSHPHQRRRGKGAFAVPSRNGDRSRGPVSLRTWRSAPSPVCDEVKRSACRSGTSTSSAARCGSPANSSGPSLPTSRRARTSSRLQAGSLSSSGHRSTSPSGRSTCPMNSSRSSPSTSVCTLRRASPTRWLFDEGGKPWHDNLVDYRWRSTRTDAAVTYKLHELRHYFASGLIAAGCDVVTVQRAMGHASATTTLSTYAHLWPTAEDKTRAAAVRDGGGVLAARLPAQVEATRSRQ